MPPRRGPAAVAPTPRLRKVVPALTRGARSTLRATTDLTVGVARVVKAIGPIIDVLNAEDDATEAQLHAAIDGLFEALESHPLVGQLRTLTSRMRDARWLPNEDTTEDLIRFLIDQVHKRSVIQIPKELTDEFWRFFDELMSEPELRGLGEVSLEAARVLVAAYEPLLVQLINQLKALRRINELKLRDIGANAAVVRGDLAIFRRQIRAIRYVRQFFEVDPKDIKGQAEVVARMVREFGPLFIKMAQVAAANADFLPGELAEALAVFREDVDPMSAEEVEAAFLECFGELPSKRYFGFDATKPLKSGSIASVYVAQKPVKSAIRGRQQLMPVVIKVGRHNLAREFLIGKTVIKLAIISSHYWAPHSKLAPFFNSWLAQIDEFVEGFNRELDFEMEADNQQRFVSRARVADGWQVPQVYVRTRRIIEMELIEDAVSLTKAFAAGSPMRQEAVQRRIGRTFLHAVLAQMVIYQEFHGDLHPGNVLVRPDERLYFIDWGNTVPLEGVWKPAVNYFVAVLAGDIEATVDAVVEMCVDRKSALAGRRELRAIVEKAFEAARVTPLGYDFPVTLYQEGQAGLVARVDLGIRLASGLARQGVVIKSEYLHFSRSVAAMVGSYLTIYQGVPRGAMLTDAAMVGWRFPFAFGRQLTARIKSLLAERLLRSSARDQAAVLA